MSIEELEARLAALEETVARLGADQGRVPEAGNQQKDMSERLWALNGLEARAPDGAVLYAGTVETPAGSIVRWQYAQTGPDLFAEDWSEQADRLAALGNPVRLKILQAVLNGVTSAARLVEEVDAGTSGQVYHHLKELTAAGWLSSPKRGVFDVPASRIVPLLSILLAAGTPQA
jgi:DNA-binding transcriptional ArsR family regulator